MFYYIIDKKTNEKIFHLGYLTKEEAAYQIKIDEKLLYVNTKIEQRPVENSLEVIEFLIEKAKYTNTFYEFLIESRMIQEVFKSQESITKKVNSQTLESIYYLNEQVERRLDELKLVYIDEELILPNLLNYMHSQKISNAIVYNSSILDIFDEQIVFLENKIKKFFTELNDFGLNFIKINVVLHKNLIVIKTNDYSSLTITNVRDSIDFVKHNWISEMNEENISYNLSKV